MALNCEIVIVGGGVLGLCAAAELGVRGHDVIVLDPGGRNASSVAAGMIAPALESVLDNVGPERAQLLREAAALWPGFARRMGIDLKPGPTAWRGPELVPMAGVLRQLGFAADVRDGAVWTEDRQVEPEPALGALTARAGRVVTQQAVSMVRRGEDWIVTLAEGTVRAPILVLATGAAPALDGLPEPVRAVVEAIIPVRGQIGWTDAALVKAVTRGDGVYVATMGRGAVIGASMGTGRRDLAVDEAESDRLRDVATTLTGQGIRAAMIDWRVGVRGATADGLPMAGPSGEPGLALALAPRRNGWLLGPLVGRIVADAVEGRVPCDQAAALDPRRQGLSQ